MAKCSAEILTMLQTRLINHIKGDDADYGGMRGQGPLGIEAKLAEPVATG